MKKSEFDEIIKQNLICAIGADSFGQGSYYTPAAFSSFIKEMDEKYHPHFEKYAAGKGSELKPQGQRPPKMASVASSSRFCYLALRDGAEALGSRGRVDFEHACPIAGIRGGIPPQMDAYVEEGNLFVEVKCHEIFDAHSIKLSAQYYDLLFGEGSDFEFSFKPEDPKAIIEISRREFGLRPDQNMVDIKQLLCHLLGIKFHPKSGPATLIYLFFRPKVLGKQSAATEQIFGALKEEIQTVFESKPIQAFAKKNGIRLRALAQYAETMTHMTEENILLFYP